jgi:hypothetical protein
MARKFIGEKMKMKLSIEVHNNYLREHKRRFHDYVSQGMPVGRIVSMPMRDIIALQANSEPQSKSKKRGPYDLA